MFLKLLGSCLIVVICSYIGFKLAFRSSQRPQEIGQIINCLVSLKSYITYIQLPLPEALDRCSLGIDGKAAALFQTVSHILKNNRNVTPQAAIHAALENMRSQLSLGSAERELLMYFAANLGALSKEDQEKHLDAVKEQFEKLQEQAQRIGQLNSKMYRYLGICGGLTIVILLF